MIDFLKHVVLKYKQLYNIYRQNNNDWFLEACSIKDSYNQTSNHVLKDNIYTVLFLIILVPIQNNDNEFYAHDAGIWIECKVDPKWCDEDKMI